MGLFFLLTNTILTIVIGMGIHAFSGSVMWGIIGALVLMSGSIAGSPILALVAYPLVELIFSDQGLSGYSAITVGITLLQMIVVFRMVKNSNDLYY